MQSANQLWKSSGTTLPFKQWIEQEKAKENFIVNKAAQEEFSNADGLIEDAVPATIYKSSDQTKTIIINVGVVLLIIGVVIIITNTSIKFGSPIKA